MFLASLNAYADVAVNKALQAAYIQTGLKRMVRTKTKYIERVYVHETIKPYLGTVFAVGKVIDDRKVKAKISNEFTVEYAFKNGNQYTVSYLCRF